MAVGVLCFVGNNDMHCDFYGLLFQKEEVVLRIIVELIPESSSGQAQPHQSPLDSNGVNDLLLTREGLV